MFGDDLGAAFVSVTGIPMFAQPTPIPLGGAIRRMKVAENESSLPQDRWIFGYNFFNDPSSGIPGVRIPDVNHYEVGLERTFCDRMGSLQIRVPFASTLASDQVADLSSARDTEFGNLYFLLKTVLRETDNTFFSGGLGLSVPTADDTQLFVDKFNSIFSTQVFFD